jgi:hypothetical protein
MGQNPMTVVAWQPRKSGVPVPVQPEQLLLFELGTHFPLGHWPSAVQ